LQSAGKASFFFKGEAVAMSDFQEALKRLVEDPAYDEAVIKDPARLVKDYSTLTAAEVLLLMQTWHSGDVFRVYAEEFQGMCHCCSQYDRSFKATPGLSTPKPSVHTNVRAPTVRPPTPPTVHRR
jgi:hypothetical protein